MDEKALRKYVRAPEERGLISAEPANILTHDGRTRNGRLMYTVLPFQDVVDAPHRGFYYAKKKLQSHRKQAQSKVHELLQAGNISRDDLRDPFKKTAAEFMEMGPLQNRIANPVTASTITRTRMLTTAGMDAEARCGAPLLQYADQSRPGRRILSDQNVCHSEQARRRRNAGAN